MNKTSFLLFLMVAILWSCKENQNEVNQVQKSSDNSILGKWVRIGQTGPMSFDFKDNGLIAADFGNNQSIDVLSEYQISGDTITFADKEGKMCQGLGRYKMYQTEYYMAFDLIDDDCGGRIKSTMGFWTKPNFKDLIKRLNDEIKSSNNPELHLNRARILMATGMTPKARDDFDTYILSDSLNARVYTNRAATRFPNDLIGVVSDCNRAILLNPDYKNAYFLRGIAHYELGEKEKGCEDFSKAIELGFSFLRIAEQERCNDYWEEE